MIDMTCQAQTSRNEAETPRMEGSVRFLRIDCMFWLM